VLRGASDDKAVVVVIDNDHRLYTFDFGLAMTSKQNSALSVRAVH
jgi:hypothetical protein